MSEYSKRRGKREAAGGSPLKNYWRQHRAWVAGLSRGAKIRYRAFQVLVVLAVVIIAAALSLRAWIRLPDIPNQPGVGAGDSSQAVSGVEYEGAQLPDVAKSGQRPGVYTFLVAGQDVVSGSTDTMILFTYDTKAKRVDGISLLRDTMINTSASSKRLNAVFARNRGDKSLPAAKRAENGMTALKAEVSKLTGIYPNYYVLVQWDAIGELVDAIGGVYFQVPFDMDYDDPTPGQDLHIHQKAGYRLLDGKDAMEVIRFRKSNKDASHKVSLGDVGRTEIQRDFLTAVVKECLQPDVLLKLPALAQIFLDNVNTDLSIGNLLAFAELAVGMDVENDMRLVSLPYTGVSYRGASMVVADQDELLELLNSGLNPYQADIQASDLQLMYKKSGGGFGVTNASLADKAMGQAAAAVPPQEEDPAGVQDPEDPQDPAVPVDPDGPADSADPAGSDQPQDPVIPTDPVVPGDDPADPGVWEDPVLPGTPDDPAQTQLPGQDPVQGGLVDAIDPDDIFPDPKNYMFQSGGDGEAA